MRCCVRHIIKNGDQELQFNSKNDEDEGDFEFSSFMSDLSTPSLPDFPTKSQPPALLVDNSWDNNLVSPGAMLGELEDELKDVGEEDQPGHDALVSYPDASRSPEHAFMPALLRSVRAAGSSYRLYLR